MCNNTKRAMGPLRCIASALAAGFACSPLPAQSADPSLSDVEVRTPCGTTAQIPGAGEPGKEGCSGNLIVALPAGPFTLYYNSQYETYNPGDNPLRLPPSFAFGRGISGLPELVLDGSNIKLRAADGSVTLYRPANQTTWQSEDRQVGDTSVIKMVNGTYELRFLPSREKLIFSTRNLRIVLLAQVYGDGSRTDYSYPQSIPSGPPPIPTSIRDSNTGKTVLLTLSPDKYVVNQIKDDKGRVYRFNYSGGGGANRRLDTITLPDGSSYKLTYDTDNARYLTSIKDPLNQYTFYSFFKHGRLKAVGTSAGNTAYAYTDSSIIAQSYNTAGTALQFTRILFDSLGYATETRSGDGSPSETAPGVLLSKLSYDPIGRVTSSTDQLGNTVNFYYNADGSCSSSATDPGTSQLPTCSVSNGIEIVTTRDQNNAPTKIVRRDPSRREVTMDMSWDSDRMTSKQLSDAQGRTTYNKSVVYDEVFPTEVTVNTTTYFDAYDELGRVVRMTGSSGIQRSYAYDQSGYTNSFTIGGITTALARNTQPDGSTTLSVTGPGGQRSFTSNFLGTQGSSTLAPPPDAHVQFHLSTTSTVEPGIGTLVSKGTNSVEGAGGTVSSQVTGTSTLDKDGRSTSTTESRLGIN